MAGLLDIFGTSGQGTLGLLGMSPQDIQSSRDDAQAQALYSLAGRLFQGGPTGQSIAQGLQMGQQAYRQAMQNQLAEQMQGAQLQEMLRKRKEEEALKQRQLAVEKIIAGAYKPAVAGQPGQMVEEEGRYIGETPGVTAQPARFDIQSAAPLLMALPEGRKALTDIVGAQKAMRPEGYSLGEGQIRYEIGADGKPYAVAQGGAKPEQLAGDVREAMQMLGIAKPLSELTSEDRKAMQAYIDRKEANKAPKVAVDLKDPTAVAKAQKDLVSDWRGVLKDFGATEVADRFKAAQQAVIQGNAGNKAADGALIYAIGKIYDPSGAVQEGDKKTILGNRNLPDTIRAYGQKVLESGSDLLPKERENLLNIAGKIVEEKSKNIEAQKVPYSTLSRDLGGSGNLLVNPLADILKPVEPVDLLSAARAELAKRGKGR